MSFLRHIPHWIWTCAALLAVAAFFKFYMRGYDYLAYAIAFAAALIAVRQLVSPDLWRVCVILVSLGLLYFCAVEIPIVKNSRTDPEPERKYLIVLGAAVIGDRPSISLERRMSSALDYLEQYPQSIAVVSGGQGPGENITEADCMYRWLTQRGVDPSRVIREPKATSTMDNLRFSFELIRERGDEPDGNVAIISSSYHLFRAKSMARLQGVEAAGVAARMGYPLSMFSSYIREAFGVTHLWVFGE